MVNFDLLRIKENLGSAPKGSTVKAREDFIDNKFKRRLRKLSETVVTAPVAPAVEPVVAEPAAPAEPTPAPTKKKIIKAAE
jgi:hypothetical protein